MKVLDIEAVLAFVLAADLKSFTRAAEALGGTQSAVSLKIRKLEEMLGRRLLERTPRLVRLSAEGEQFIEAARSLVAAHQQAIAAFTGGRRKLVVGISHHIVGAELPVLLKKMSQSEPTVAIEMRVSTSRQLLADFDEGLLDAVIVLHHDGRPRDGGETIHRESFCWMAAPDFQLPPGEPLRLATPARPCGVRSMAVDALDRAGIPWTEAFVGGGLATIGAAVSAGLAAAALCKRVAPADAVEIGSRFNLPPLPDRDVTLYRAPTDRQARNALRTLSAAIRSTAP